MASFPAVIPDDEKVALDTRRFADYAAPHLNPPAPVPPPEPGPAAPPMPGGFDPGAQPPPENPEEQAMRFAAYVQPHLDDNSGQTSQGAPGGLSSPEMAPDATPGLPPPSAQFQPAFGAAEADRPPSEFDPAQPQDDAQRFLDYTQRYLGPDPGRPSIAAEASPSDVVGAIGSTIRGLIPTLPQPPVVPGSLEGDRPPSEFEQPNPDEWRLNPLPPDANVLHRGLHTVAQTILDMGEPGRRGMRTLMDPNRDPRAPLSEDEMIPALALTGEPLANAGAKVAGKVAGEVARLRLDKFPEGVRDVIQQAAEDGDFWMRQRRGVIPDDVAEQMADKLGKDVDQLIGLGRRKGVALNTEQTRAVRNGLVAQSMKVNEIAAQVRQDPTNGALVAEQIAEGMKLADLSRVAEGARAEAGRSLRAYQTFARDFAADPVSAVQRIYRANNLTPEQAAQKVTAFQQMVADGADPFQMGRFWANIERPPPNAADWFNLVRYNAMLSGPRTLMVNALGNAAEIPWRGLRDVGASIAKGRPEEIAPEAIGLARGFQRGIGAALETLQHGVTAEQAATGEIPRAISSRLENGKARNVALALEAPGRAMEATDQFFRQMAYGMALGRQAAVKAGEEGLRGRALLDRADELMAQPTAGMMTTANAIADRMTYKGELGPVAGAFTAIQRIPILGNVLVPFLRTVAHITNRGIDRSPLGLATTGFDVARGAYKGGRIPAGQAPLGERVADNLAGTVGAAGLYYLANQGRITGAGPDDPQLRDMLRAQGWQPYSIKVGDRYYGYQQFGPFAVPLSLAAGAAEAQRYAKPGASGQDVALDAFRRTAQLLTEQPYLQGIGAIYKGMTDPGRYGERWIEGFMQSVVPYGAAINTAGQVLDPYEREPKKGDVAGALATRFPGLREQQAVKQDVLGRPVESQQAGLGAFVPTRSSASRPDEALQTLLAAGVQVPDPPKTIPAGGQNIALTPDEQRAYQRSAGAALSARVADLTRSSVWADLPPERQKAQLQRAVDGAHREARADVLESLSDDEIARRRDEARAVKQTRNQPRPGLPLP